MKLKISFKHLKHTPALDERIKEKSEKLDKYFEGNTSVSWVCWVHGDEHWAEIKVHGPGFDFFAKAFDCLRNNTAHHHMINGIAFPSMNEKIVELGANQFAP